MGLEDRLVVIYSGAIDQWHTPEAIVELFKLIKSIEPGSFFLGLTTDPQRLRRVLYEKGINDSDGRALAVSFEQIGEILACGDIGLLIREEHLLNRYSCPTKFAEYLAGGEYCQRDRRARGIFRDIYGEDPAGAQAGWHHHVPTGE